MSSLTLQQIEETRQLLEKHAGNLAAVARELNLTRSTVQNRVQRLSETVQKAANSNEKPRVRVPYLRAVEPPPVKEEVEAIRVYKILAIGDPHIKPGRTEHMRAIGRHAAKGKFDAVIFIGDVGCLPSLSTHEIPGSVGDMDRPSFAEDLHSIDEGLDTFHSEAPVGSLPIYLLYGNHEERAWTAASKMPKTCGDMPARLDAVFTSRGWKTFRYGARQTLFGVDWVHTPLNRMRKPSNGDFAERTHGLKSVRDLVVGHSHIYNVVTVIKNSERTRVVNLGSAMPWGTIEKYQSPDDPPLDYGITEIRIKDGRIIGNKFIDMLELEEMYGN